MHGQHANYKQQLNSTASGADEDLDIEFFTEQDLQQPCSVAARHTETTHDTSRAGYGAADQEHSPVAQTPLGFEEVDAASLAALLGQEEASTMCNIVFCDADSSPGAAGSPFAPQYTLFN